MTFSLICSSDNERMLRDVLSASGILICPASRYVICEQGIEFSGTYDVMIRFRMDSIGNLIELLGGFRRRELARITGISDDGFVPLELGRIAFFNACGNDTFANTTDGQCFKIKHKLYELEESILPRSFIRINKSEIINIKHVIKIIPMFKGKLILKIQGYKNPLDISRNYTKEFKERIGL